MDTVPIRYAEEPDLSEIGDLLAGVARGEPAAFDRLYMSTRARLFRLIYVTVRDVGFAEEVMQEAYLEVWHKAHLYQPHRGKPLSWLMMICHRRAIDRVRSEESRRRRTELVTIYSVHIAHGGADEPVLVRDEHREVRRQLASLTILQQQSIAMTYYDNLTHKESAERLGIPLSTFKTRLRDGLSQLRTLQSHTERECSCA
jgi:RNA polymerase sigma-70 factor (ECF subfamily)